MKTAHTCRSCRSFIRSQRCYNLLLPHGRAARYSSPQWRQQAGAAGSQVAPPLASAGGAPAAAPCGPHAPLEALETRAVLRLTARRSTSRRAQEHPHKRSAEMAHSPARRSSPWHDTTMSTSPGSSSCAAWGAFGRFDSVGSDQRLAQRTFSCNVAAAGVASQARATAAPTCSAARGSGSACTPLGRCRGAGLPLQTNRGLPVGVGCCSRRAAAMGIVAWAGRMAGLGRGCCFNQRRQMGQ